MIQTSHTKPRLSARAMVLILACCCADARAGQAPSRPATLADLQKIQEQLKALATEVQSLRQENTQLKQELAELKTAKSPPAAGADEELDLAKLREAAQAEAAADVAPEGGLKATIFKAKGLGLQALNPEISMAGDMYARYRDDHGKPLIDSLGGWLKQMMPLRGARIL